MDRRNHRPRDTLNFGWRELMPKSKDDSRREYIEEPLAQAAILRGQ